MTAPEGEPFSRTNLPGGVWRAYRKTTATAMTRIEGLFWVETREGTLSCPDGYLALGGDGWPYPIAADYHDANYLPTEYPKLSV
jgi:hypothetical protein